MKEDWAISHDTAAEVARLINEYLFQGGSGFDDEKLADAREALMWADRIRIIKTEEDYDEED
jgi:hypothetical protein